MNHRRREMVLRLAGSPLEGNHKLILEVVLNQYPKQYLTPSKVDVWKYDGDYPDYGGIE